MSASDDISNLFKRFGGHSEQYREITDGEQLRASIERWPVVSGREAAPPAEPEQTPPAPSPTVAAESSRRPSAWSSDGLQSLLAKVAQEDDEAPLAPAPAVAEPPTTRPDLSHIRIVAVVSAKGGVGKSTMAANMAAALQKTGRPVLALDLDPQNALYRHFQPAVGVETDESALGLAQLDQPWRERGLFSRNGVFVLPYGQVDEEQRADFEAGLRQDPFWLARNLAELELSDGAFVVIDTPPGPSVYLRQALSVANVALVVSLADAASYTAIPQIDELIKTHAEGRADFFGSTYLVNQVDNAQKLSKDITQILRDLLGERLIGVVHRDQSITEALAYGRNVLDYDPHGRGCQDILDCARLLIVRLVEGPPAEAGHGS